MLKIVIDAMGGDNGVEPIISGIKQALQTREFQAIVVGDKKLIESCLDSSDKIEIYDCPDYIRMEDNATDALRRKDSSIYKAIDIVKNNEADVVISAGHSGASMSLATLRFGRIEGISRPAISTSI